MGATKDVLRVVQNARTDASIEFSKATGKSLETEQRGVGEEMVGFRGSPRCSRKEVIQPQVPLRLPCYDFTPVTRHSLGTYLPCGLAQPLLEQLTPMV